jgi:4-hydroxybenzoate polyprenyltransferase
MSMRSRIRQLFDLGRLYLLPGTILALYAGVASYGELGPLNAIKAFFAALLLNFVFFSPNDVFDRETDRENDRKGTMFKGLVEERGFPEKLAGLSVGVGYLTALLAGGTIGLALAAVTTVSVLYSVPPVRLKSRPPFDSIVNGVGVFFIFSTGVAIAGGGFSDVISGAYWFSAIAAGFHVLMAAPDIEADREAGIRTTAMYLGWRGSAILCQAIILAALFFENWSTLTRNFLVLMFTGIFLMWREWEKKNLTRIVFLGGLAMVGYLGFYAYRRGLV